MAKGFKHGTGGGGKQESPLNFQVKTYPSETELMGDTPSENTIGVITTTTMKDWVFSATEPAEPAVGMVWFVIGDNSSVSFDAITENELHVYPLYAKQYIGGAWEKKTAKIRQSEAWCDWRTYLYHKGDTFDDLTGGWQVRGWKANSDFNSKAPTLTKNADNMVVELSASSDSAVSGVLECIKDIDLTNRNKIKIEFSASASSALSVTGSYLGVLDRTSTYVSANCAAQLTLIDSDTTIVERNTVELDVSNVSGVFDVVLYVGANHSGKTKVTVFDIWME